MQVPLAGWANSAAHVQQGLSTQRSNSTSTTPAASQQLNPIEQSQKTGDRDANERYEGPLPHGSGSGEERAKDDGLHDSQACDLQLPADDGEVSQLDITG